MRSSKLLSVTFLLSSFIVIKSMQCSVSIGLADIVEIMLLYITLEVLNAYKGRGMKKINKFISRNNRKIKETDANGAKWNKTGDRYLNFNDDGFKYVEVPVWHLQLLGDKLQYGRHKLQKLQQFKVRGCPASSNIVAK